MPAYRASRAGVAYVQLPVPEYKHFVIVKSCPESSVNKTVQAITTWFAATHPGILDGEPVPREDHKPSLSRYSDDSGGCYIPRSRTIIYVNLLHDSELVVNSFVAFIGEKAIEYAPSMVCIQQNEAKKSVEVVYGLLVITPDCQDKKNLQQDFSAFGRCAFHQSSRCMDVMYVNY